MVMKISQQTFNDAVKENIEDLGMEPAEALEEAIKQFQAQGVDLSQIKTNSMTDTENYPEIEAAVKKLGELVKAKGSNEAVIKECVNIRNECDKDLQHKVAAGNAGAYSALLLGLKSYKDLAVRAECLQTLLSLMTKHPDLLDNDGLKTIMDNLRDENLPLELQRLFLKWTKECCVMHEKNRQHIFDAHILEVLKKILSEADTADVIRDALSVCRALVLDDDVRVEFGRAHEHARIIASEILCSLMNLLTKFSSEENLIHDIMLTMSTLMVRTEFCKKVQDAEGLELIGTVMDHFHKNEKIIRQCFKLLKALAGNDEVKCQILQKHNLQRFLMPILDEYVDSVQTVTNGLACVAALSLRSPENSKILYETATPQIIVHCMERHPDQKAVQRIASWAIRNMVSRSKYQTKTFLDAGVEPLLHKAMKNFKDIEYDIKAALRDLGCNVQLKEEWTGKGGALTTGLHKGHH